MNYDEILKTIGLKEYKGCDLEYFEDAFENNDKGILDKVIERESIQLITAYVIYLLMEENNK